MTMVADLRCLRGACLAVLPLLLAANPAGAVVGASLEGGAEAAHVVMVLHRQGNAAGFCSGVVVAQDIVMTAAHCVPKGADLRIHFPGAGTDPVMLPVAAVARHPDYQPDAIKRRERSIDLALVRLPKPLPAPFQLSKLAGTAGAKVGAPFTIAGYGVTHEGEAASSGQLRMASLSTRAPTSSVLLWADDPAKAGLGACTGDSGGPVLAPGGASVVALILWSAGDGGKQCGSLTQALWLAPHRAWIDRVMQAWGAAASW